MLKIGVFFLVALASGFAGGAWAQPGDEIIVLGERRGPRLLRVENALPAGLAEVFILLSVDTVPKDLDWDETQVAQVLEETDEVLILPDAEIGAGNRTRLIGTMLNTMLFNRDRIMMAKNTSLDDKVGAELAARFRRARARLEAIKAERKADRKNSDGEDDTGLAEDDLTPEETAVNKRLEKLEPGRMHPFFQAQSLIASAYDAGDLTDFERIEKRIAKLANKSPRKPNPKVRPIVEIDVRYKDIKTILKSVKSYSDETNRLCIENAIVFVEEELSDEVALANAWARGDFATLKALAADDPSQSPCLKAVSAEIGGLKTLGGQSLDDYDWPSLWLDELIAALGRPGVRLAIVPAATWLREDGIRERLASSGYDILGEE